MLYLSRGRVCGFGLLHVFLSPGINILDDPEMELPPLKMSTALPRSFHQIISLTNPVHWVCMHREGDSEETFEPLVNFIRQVWTVLAKLATGRAPV